MHDCIFKLLRSDKQEPIEDNLECLCKLLATIGKDLDHKKASVRCQSWILKQFSHNTSFQNIQEETRTKHPVSFVESFRT